MIKGLPADCFVSDDLFEREAETVFGSNWIAVGSIHDFEKLETKKESFRKIDFGSNSAVLIRHVEGSFAAFHNVCRHRGTRLVTEAAGELKNGCITCPYHAWSYDRCGKLIGAPNMTEVKDFDRSGFGLSPIAVEVWADLVFMNFGDPESRFDDALSPLLDRMENWQLDRVRIKKTLSYDVQANWKLIFQNYSECYHCPTVHPDLNQQTPYKSATNDLEEGPILGGPMQLANGYETVSSDGKSVGPFLDGLDAEQRRSIYYYTIFPNLFVSAHPDYVMIHRLSPIGFNRTEVNCHFLAGEVSTADSLSRAWKMWDGVNRQDWRVCELTQLGAQSPAFQPGPYSNLETMLMAFDRHYRSVMNLSS